MWKSETVTRQRNQTCEWTANRVQQFTHCVTKLAASINAQKCGTAATWTSQQFSLAFSIAMLVHLGSPVT